MNDIITEYTYINSIGMFFIPKYIQELSNFKFDKNNFKCLSYSVSDNNIIVTLKDASNKNKNFYIDELGRIVIPIWCRKELRISVEDILIMTLIDKNTLLIKPLITKDYNKPYKYDFIKFKPDIYLMNT